TNKTAEPKVGQTKLQPPVTKKEQSAASDSKSIPQQKTSTATTQKIEVQQEHNEDKKPVAVASLSGCVCKDYDLIWGKTTKFVNC
ncbi:peptidoglycan-binding protein, partial [Acinetobacter baumannii]